MTQNFDLVLSTVYIGELPWNTENYGISGTDWPCDTPVDIKKFESTPDNVDL